ncbi:MAG: threonylcarbamoyl-AMP synthase [Leptospira sp.]|nr:threonylcarbamoyl-AMP synthase [Leptospira sp.]
MTRKAGTQAEIKTQITEDPDLAGNCIRAGGIVIFPTETVYGIGCSAENESSCYQIYRIKKRPLDNPFILHVPDPDAIYDIAHVDPEFIPLIEKFSPGPLTYILPKKKAALFTSGLSTIAVRIPDYLPAIRMLTTAGVPVGAPSANFSGKPSGTRFEDIVSDFSGKVDMILRGGDSGIGIESTVVDLTGKDPVLLRPGKITEEELRAFLPRLRKNKISENQAPVSPGLKYRHYAPDCEVILLENMSGIDEENSGQIGFKLVKKSVLDYALSDNVQYMHSLYSFFIECDKKKLKKAYCEMPKDDKYKDSILNRIVKAMNK